jgi:hypothetical protein
LVLGSAEQRLELNRASAAEMRGGERKGMYCHVGVPTNSPVCINLCSLRYKVSLQNRFEQSRIFHLHTNKQNNKAKRLLPYSEITSVNRLNAF